MKGVSVATISVTARRGGHAVGLTGPVDERFDGSAVLSLSGCVVFDLDGVRRITSSGVRKWLEMLRGIKARSYCFVHCRPAMVSQFNLVRQFGGSGQIVSLYAPYVCDKCSAEVDQLIDLRRDHGHLYEIAKAGVTC